MKLETCFAVIERARADPRHESYVEDGERRIAALGKCNVALRGVITSYMMENAYGKVIDLFDVVQQLMESRVFRLTPFVLEMIAQALVCLKIDEVHGFAVIPYDWYVRMREVVEKAAQYYGDRQCVSEGSSMGRAILRGIKALYDVKALSNDERCKVGDLIMRAMQYVVKFFDVENWSDSDLFYKTIINLGSANHVFVVPEEIKVFTRASLCKAYLQDSAYTVLRCFMLGELCSALQDPRGCDNVRSLVPSAVYFPAEAALVQQVLDGTAESVNGLKPKAYCFGYESALLKRLETLYVARAKQVISSQ